MVLAGEVRARPWLEESGRDQCAGGTDTVSETTLLHDELVG
jgi:hypothetical protein